VGCTPTPVLGEILRRLVLGDSYIFEGSFSFCSNLDEEFLILFFIVPGAPVMEVAVDTVLYFDIHKI